MHVEVVEADLTRKDHAAAIVALLDGYSRDPTANGCGLSEDVKRELVPGLRAHPGTHVFLAFRASAAIGVAVCFRGFSTFAARPLMNIHDVAVDPMHRGSGVGRALMNAIETRARDLGCCKLTLEVQENGLGRALFWQKKLS